MALVVITQIVPMPNVIPSAKARNDTCTVFWKIRVESAADPGSPGPVTAPASRMAWRETDGRRPAWASRELATHRSVARITATIRIAITAMNGSVRRKTARYRVTKNRRNERRDVAPPP